MSRHPNFLFLINGEPVGKVIPYRGIRQGCPLPPYLFLLCGECFSLLLRQAESEGTLRGIKCARQAPQQSHLLFADNSIIFFHADKRNCQAIKGVLEKYEQTSGY